MKSLLGVVAAVVLVGVLIVAAGWAYLSLIPPQTSTGLDGGPGWSHSR